MAERSGPILEVKNITKRFPGVVALDDVSVAFEAGQVHAIVGENGAGKSTLMKIMAGVYRADEGTVLFQGEPVAFAHPKQAQDAGISIVYQEFNLLPDRTVAQNIFFGREPSRYGLVDSRELNRRTAEVLEALGAGELISPNSLLGSLPVALQQIVEIAKATAFDSKVLIMDEPTASLSSNEVAILKDLIDRLIERNLAIMFISHRFNEIFAFADMITVLKDGQMVGTKPVKETSRDEIIEMMVGRKLDQFYPSLGDSANVGDVKLRVVNGANNKLRNINLEVRAGEIVGISGLQGSGRTELAQAIFGVDPFTTGHMEINGKKVHIRSAAQAIKTGLGFVTEDRKAEGILPNQPVKDNMLVTLRALRSLFARTIETGVKEKPNLVPNLAEQVDVRAASYEVEVQFLSGGNQQKVVLGKWLASTAKILIFDEPTRGIDVDAKASIHEMIRGLADEGAAVLMISSELPEIIGMSDRIMVMWDGQLVGQLPAKSSESEIMTMATGHVIDEVSEPEKVTI